MKTNAKAEAVRNMNTMSVSDFKNKMGDARCVIVTFYKRTDGELCTIRCNRAFAFNKANAEAVGYVAPNGKGLRYNNEAHCLVTVFDLDEEKHKQIPANSVIGVVVC